MKGQNTKQRIWRSIIRTKKVKFHNYSDHQNSASRKDNEAKPNTNRHLQQQLTDAQNQEDLHSFDNLKKSERHFRILAEMAPQIIWSSNEKGEIKYLNPFWYQFSGLSEIESHGNNWKKFVHPSDRETLDKIWHSGITMKKPFHLEFRLLNKNNAYEWFLCKAVPMCDKNSQVDCWIGTFTDIEEQKQILHLVKEKAEEFEILADNITHQVWVENFNGDAEYMNKMFYDYTGLKQPDIFTSKRLEIFHPEDFEDLKDAWYRSKKERTNFEYEARIRRVDGNYRWFKIRAMPIKDNQGNINKWIGTNTDIHEQKTFEKQKDDFMNVASHELKTPLTTIKGYIQMVAALLEQKKYENLNVLIQNASKSVEKLNKLVEDLLDISRIESGQIGEFEMEPFPIDQLLNEIMERHKHLNPERIFFMEGDTNVQVFGNRYRLEQVFDNLLSNAVKYSPADKDISVMMQRTNGKVKISILDHGDGISKENVDRVFDRFYRTDDNTLSGLGLGLFISREIIKLHKGEIWVESEVGKGSTFHVELPL